MKLKQLKRSEIYFWGLVFPARTIFNIIRDEYEIWKTAHYYVTSRPLKNLHDDEQVI